MLDPRSGAVVYPRFALLHDNPGPKLLPARPMPRSLKCVWDGRRTLRYVFRLLRRILDHQGLCEEYFSPSFESYGLSGNEPWAEIWNHNNQHYRWLACYPVTGSNEGHYIHVELIGFVGFGEGAARLPLFTGKTFKGMESATRAATLLAHLLGA